MTSSLLTSHFSRLVEGRIVGRRGEHLIPRSKTTHDFKPEMRQAIQSEQRRISFLNEPGFLLHLGFKLTRSPPCITDKCTKCHRLVLARRGARLLQCNLMAGV